MINWLRLLLMTFYAPWRGMKEIRDRAALAPTAFVAFLTQLAYAAVTRKFAGNLSVHSGGAIFGELFQAAITVVLIAIVLVPILTLVANIFDRRGSFRVVITQEYAPVATSMFYVLMAANLISIVIAVLLHYSGVQANQVAIMIQQADQTRAMFPIPDTPQFAPVAQQLAEQLRDPGALAESLFFMPKFVIFSIGMIFAVRDSFRISALRSVGVIVVSCFIALFVAPIAVQLFSGVLGSPFLVLLLFFLLRGYFTDIVGTQRARAAFKQNLEAATLNPADASAHYNLGLIHQNRGEFDAARERFERAVQIDPEEIDAYYQLGRIARQQKRFSDAVQNFEQVVTRDPSHSQYEVWREVAATYISANQFDDARNALEQFLEHRPSDPEGLYLMGRAHAGLGHNREATSLMHACIEAVKTAPAYKYRSDKRWLNEAEQFIKGGQ